MSRKKNYEENEDGGAEHPANPALIEQPTPVVVTVPLSKEERLNMSIRMTLLMDEKKANKEDVLKLNRSCKNLDKEIEALATCVRINTKEIQGDNPQQDLLHQGVGGQAAAEQFSQMAEDAAKANPDASEDTKAVDALNEMAAGAQAAAGVPAASDGFEASADELGRQGGRKHSRKQAA